MEEITEATPAPESEKAPDIIWINEFWVKFKIYVYNPIALKYEIAYYTHNLAKLQIEGLMEVYLKDAKGATKILFSDGSSIKSPTTLEKLEAIFGIKPYFAWGVRETTVKDEMIRPKG